MRSRVTALMWVLCGFAASSAAAQTAAPANPAALPTVDVTAVTPLSGSGIDVDKAPTLYRRLVEKLLKEEAAGASATA